MIVGVPRACPGILPQCPTNYPKLSLNLLHLQTSNLQVGAHAKITASFPLLCPNNPWRSGWFFSTGGERQLARAAASFQQRCSRAGRRAAGGLSQLGAVLES